MESEALQQIPVVPLLPSARVGRKFLDWLRQRDFILRAFGGGFLLSLLLNLALCILLLCVLRKRTQVAVLAPAGGIYWAEGEPLNEARELHEELADRATAVLLARGPDGFRFSPTLPRLFSPRTRVLAEQLNQNELPDFKQRQLRQTPEVARVEIRTSPWSESDALVTGQLVRSGHFAGQPVEEFVPFSLRLSLSRNPDLLKAARYPLVITSFTLTYDAPRR